MSALQSPSQRVWWKQPIDRVEGTWIVLSLIWCLIMFFITSVRTLFEQIQLVSRMCLNVIGDGFVK